MKKSLFIAAIFSLCYFSPAFSDSWAGRADKRPELFVDMDAAYKAYEYLEGDGGDFSLALDTSGRYLAFTPYLDRVMVWDLQTAEPWTMAWGISGGGGVVFSLDGRYVYHAVRGVVTWDFRQERAVEDCVDWNHRVS